MKRSRKEAAYLRALLGPAGPDGEIRREFGAGLTLAQQKAVRRELATHREGGTPSQVEEMREAAGRTEKTETKGGTPSQVEEMREAATRPPFPGL